MSRFNYGKDDEGGLHSETDGNIGSIFAIGFPAPAGGALQFIKGIGVDDFMTRAHQLAGTYGERFRVNDTAITKLFV